MSVESRKPASCNRVPFSEYKKYTFLSVITVHFFEDARSQILVTCKRICIGLQDTDMAPLKKNQRFGVTEDNIF